MHADRESGAMERGETAPEPPGETGTRPAGASPSRVASWAGWKRWVRPAVYATYSLAVAASAPLVILDGVRASGTPDGFKRTLSTVAFFAMVVTIPVSVWGILNHALCYTSPAIQKYIIRILWLVPIFELNSWFALRFTVVEIYLDTLRQLYQAFVIYNYVFYLLTFYEEIPDFHARLALKPQIKSPPPCCCAKAVPNERIINRCKAGVLNYTVIRVIFSVVSITTDLLGKFNEGSYSPRSAYLWVTIVVAASQIWAIFCMVLLRRATRDDLKLLPRSTPQFIGIQVVVFCANFQSIILTVLAAAGAMEPKPEWGFESPSAFATMLQDFLICLELVPGAFIFTYAYDYQRYNTDSERRSILPKSLKRALNAKHNIVERLRFGGSTYTAQHNADDSSADEQEPDSPTPLRNLATSPSKASRSSSDEKPAHRAVSPLPDVINGAPRRPETGIQDGGAHHKCGYDHQRESGRGEVFSDGTLTDGLLSDGTLSMGDEWTDDDDDDDRGDGRSVVDPQLDRVPSSRRPPAISRRRPVKKVSVLAGLNFEDMNWEDIKKSRSATVSSSESS